MSEELKQPAEFEPPELWGIDPDETWEWTPCAGRVLVAPGEWDSESRSWKSSPKHGAALPGALVVLIGPMDERLSLKVHAARQRLQSVQAREMMKALDAGATLADATEKAVDVSIAQDIYSDALVAEVLSFTIKGWRNLFTRAKRREIPFSGDWKKDSIALLPAYQIELFRDIVSETLFEGEGQKDSFTSTPDSAAG